MRKFLSVTALVGAAALLIPPSATAANPAPPTTITYAESTSVIPNPQRGFYHHTETHYRADGSGWTPLDRSTLDGYRAEGITQVLRVVYLEKFVNQPQLDHHFLDLLQQDYATARAAGVSVITRFAYVQGGAWPYEPPYGDAPLDVVLAHIRQLGPILRANADVIPVVQEGFIGLWGEGYYTDHFVSDPANPGVVTDTDWARRNAVAEALLDELPPQRGIQVRTMLMKQKLLGVPSGPDSAVTADQAFTNTTIARVGHHNDCLLAAPDDWGTFLSDPITLDQNYLEKDSTYVPVGGETCNVNPPRSQWPSASAELARYHYSYLNRDYNQNVLNSWGAAGLTEAAQRLGYRFVMTTSTVSHDHDGVPLVSIDVRNDGWAAPYTPRPATLILTKGRHRVEIPAGSDARSWLPGTTTTLRVRLEHVEPGRYSIGLALPSPDAGTAKDPRFAIQTANTATWNATSGVNELHQTVVIPGRTGLHR